MILYVLALHIIFVVTWFAGLFYIVRLFIYHSEAEKKTEPEKIELTPEEQITALKAEVEKYKNEYLFQDFHFQGKAAER